MLLRHSFHLESEAASIENAVKQVLAEGHRTRDLAEKGAASVSTQQMGDLVMQQLRSVAARA
jgi:3-isopropylmalate dehydrogenase